MAVRVAVLLAVLVAVLVPVGEGGVGDVCGSGRGSHSGTEYLSKPVTKPGRPHVI